MSERTPDPAEQAQPAEPADPAEQTNAAERADTRRRTRIVVVAVAAGVILAGGAVAIALSMQPGGGGAAPDPGPTGSGIPSATPSADATDAPDPSAPAEDPDAPAEDPDAPAGDPVVADQPDLPIDEPADISPGLTAAIASLEAVDGEATGPGEIAGPSVRVTISIANTTDEPADLTGAVVTAYSGEDLAPALELREPGGRALPATVAPGATATGVFVFQIEPERRDIVRIMLDTAVGIDPLVFAGPAPR
jgi:hypothetical protein